MSPAPDGRVLMTAAGEASADGARPQIVVAQNWTEELKRLVPVP